MEENNKSVSKEVIERLVVYIESCYIPAYEIAKIANSFPDLNPEWLMTGKGNMLKEDFIDKGDDWDAIVSKIKNDAVSYMGLPEPILMILYENDSLKDKLTAKNKIIASLKKQLVSM